MQPPVFTKRILLACLALVAWSGVALAHPPMGPMGDEFGGADMFMMERMAAELDLSDAQRASVDKLMQESRDAARPWVRKLIEQHRAMRALIDADNFDEAAVRAQAAQNSAAMTELAVIHARNQHDLRALLTPEQRDKLSAMHRPRRGH